MNRTNLPNHFTFELPAAGFNPLRASAGELERYGIIHRPDPRQTPRAARHWRRVMGRINRFIAPQLTTRSDIAHGPAQNWQPVSSLGASQSGTTDNWSGLVAQGEAPYLQVWGTWTVPAVYGSPEQSANLNSAAWVGLGGFTDRNILQAGTEQDVESDGTPICYAWVQWYPAPALVVNLPVAAGQTVTVYVGNLNDGSGQGVFAMANLSTGVAIPMTTIPIPEYDIFGQPIAPPLTGPSTSSAEWIMERPAPGQGDGTFLLSQLSDYGEHNMTNAGALSGATAKTEVIVAASDPDMFSLAMLNETPAI